MNAYEQKQQDRRERFEARAEKAEQASVAAFEASRAAVEGIVFGQPILVGHHSEARHRGAVARSDRAMRKSCAESDKAQHYAEKAAAVGTGGISSDDPEAVKKLRAELAGLELTQERMKAANKAIRANKTDEARVAALVAEGYSESEAADLVKPDFARRVGFPAYALTNNSANVRRIKARIAELEKRSERGSKELQGQGYTYREDTEENRVMFVFEGKPDEGTRTLLKQHAFKWSPTRGAWVRQLTNAGIWAGKQVREALGKAAALA